MMMGVWFLSSAFATYVAGMIAGTMAIEETPGTETDVLSSLMVYGGVFEKLALVAMVLGFVVLIFSPMLHKRMHGVH